MPHKLYQNKPDSNFFVAHLPSLCTAKDVEAHFALYGPVKRFILQKRPNGGSRNFGWLTFERDMPNFLQQGPFFFRGVELTVEASHRDESEDTSVSGKGVKLEKSDPRESRHRKDEKGSKRERRRHRSRDDRDRSGSRISSHSSYSRSSSDSDSRRRRRRHRRNEQLDEFSADGAPSLYPAPLPTSLPPAPIPTTTAPAAPPSLSDPDMFVCLPAALCPPQLFNGDPRVFAARLDRTRVGLLTICGPAMQLVPAPTPQNLVPTPVPAPPPPPPPPPLPPQLPTTVSSVPPSFFRSAPPRNLLQDSTQPPPYTAPPSAASRTHHRY